jgi:hypothetical protein
LGPCDSVTKALLEEDNRFHTFGEVLLQTSRLRYCIAANVEASLLIAKSVVDYLTADSWLGRSSRPSSLEEATNRGATFNQHESCHGFVYAIENDRLCMRMNHIDYFCIAFADIYLGISLFIRGITLWKQLNIVHHTSPSTLAVKPSAVPSMIALALGIRKGH